MSEQQQEGYDFLFKIVLIGDSSVGKTNIFTKYLNDEFDPDSKATVGVEFGTKNFKIEEKIIKVQIWDTAGQERYRSITNAYYKGAKGCLLVYDITNKTSFENIEKWVDDIIDKSKDNKNLIIYLIGNKIDLERKVLKEDAIQLASKLNIKYFESSNKLNLNIYEIVSHMIMECCSSAQIDNETKGAKIFIGEEKKKRKCC